MKPSAKTWGIALGALGGVAMVAALVFAREGHRAQATIPAGTTVVGELGKRLSTADTHVGDGIELRTVAAVTLSDGATLAPGQVVRGVVTEAKGGGRVAGAPLLAIRFTEIEVDGERHGIVASPFRVEGRNDAGRSAAQIGAGAVAGGILGRVAGGKGGTVKGAVVGAAIGTGVAVATEGQQLVLHRGQPLKVRLTEPVTVSYQPTR
jgi:hypothetical protein